MFAARLVRFPLVLITALERTKAGSPRDPGVLKKKES